MDEAITKAYPKTGGVASLRAKVTMATLKGLEQQKESTLSRALFFASQAANKCVHWTIATCAPEYHASLDEAGDRFCRMCGQPLSQ